MRTHDCGIPIIFRSTPDRNLISSSLVFWNCFPNNNFKALSIAHIAEHCAVVQYIRRHIEGHDCKHVIEYLSGRTNYDYTAFSINSLKKGYPYVLDIFNSILETRKLDEDIFCNEIKNVILEYPTEGLNSFNSKCKFFDSFINEHGQVLDTEKIIREINISEVEEYLKDCYVPANALITFLGDVEEQTLLKAHASSISFSPVTSLNIMDGSVKSIDGEPAAYSSKSIYGASCAFGGGKCEVWLGFKTNPALSIREFFTYDVCFLLISSIFKNSYRDLLKGDLRFRSIEFQNVGCSYQLNSNYIAFRYVFGSEPLLQEAAEILKAAIKNADSHQKEILRIKQEYMDSFLMKLDDLRYANQFFTRMNYLFNSYVNDFKYYQAVLESIEAEDIWSNTAKILDCRYILAFSETISEDMLEEQFTESVLT